jgi:hypothetical protein
MDNNTKTQTRKPRLTLTAAKRSAAAHKAWRTRRIAEMFPELVALAMAEPFTDRSAAAESVRLLIIDLAFAEGMRFPSDAPRDFGNAPQWPAVTQ